ncbi:MAG: hypothetical protein M1826_000376 [Phylliscum demangeonii]|nr:MAG: hypothetical protein M1826_000376 [Phylliscum demangeonii]
MADLPLLHQHPSSTELLAALEGLATTPPSWTNTAESDVPEDGALSTTRYLTSIVASKLSWIAADSAREAIWAMASMPAITRTFTVPSRHDAAPIEIQLHEPSLTADDLGLKTWAASYVLARRLHALAAVPHLVRPGLRGLELGAGTGLVGIAAAAVWGARMQLTDLARIVPNLARNVHANERVIRAAGGQATASLLDWKQEAAPGSDGERYDVVLLADLLYAAEHAPLLCETIRRWLKKDDGRAWVALAVPLREADVGALVEFKAGMERAGLSILTQGEEEAYDDWEEGPRHGRRRPVRCWWAVWTRTSSMSASTPTGI